MWEHLLTSVELIYVSYINYGCLGKHCQRHNGPEGRVYLAKVTLLGHITSTSRNTDQSVRDNRQISQKFKLQNLA